MVLQMRWTKKKSGKLFEFRRHNDELLTNLDEKCKNKSAERNIESQSFHTYDFVL